MTTTTSNCCTILKRELNPCQDYFSSSDSTGRLLDIEDSFGLSSAVVILSKVALAGFTIFTWISTFLAADYKGFFFAYLTLWALTMQVLYHVISIANSLFPPPGINARVKFTWWFFNMVVHTDLIVVILFWYAVYDPDTTTLTFNNVSPHAVTAGILLLEGFVINRIPIRVFHWWGSVLPLNILYPTWTIVHSFTDIGNPNETDQDGNDDEIYEAVDWSDDPLGSAIFIVVVVVIVGPLLQLLLFVISLYSPMCRVSRRYLDDPEKEMTHSNHDEEMYAVGY